MKPMIAPKPQQACPAQRMVEKKKTRSYGDVIFSFFLTLFVLIVPAFFMFQLAHPFIYPNTAKLITPIPRIVMISLTAVVMSGIVVKQKQIMKIHLGVVTCLLAWPIMKVQESLVQLFYWSEGSEPLTLAGAGVYIDRGFAYMTVSAVHMLYILCCAKIVYDLENDLKTLPSTSVNKKTTGLVDKEKLVVSNV